jgi:hypothetical protein
MFTVDDDPPVDQIDDLVLDHLRVRVDTRLDRQVAAQTIMAWSGRASSRRAP